MEVTSTKDKMFQRLANIVKERFDTNITFTDYAVRLRVADVGASTVVRRNAEAQFVICGDDVLLPLRGERNLFGFVTVFNGTRLAEEALSQIRDVTDLLLTSTCALEEKDRQLKLLDHHLSSPMDYESIVDLHMAFSEQEIHSVDPEITVRHHAVDKIFPILIQSNREVDAKEFALSIHQDDGRGAFVTYEDYIAFELRTVDTLREMGPITLFFPNLLFVPMDIQKVVGAYLKSLNRTVHHPRILVGVQEDPEYLVDIMAMDPGLFEALASARVKLPPKGVSTMSLDEILEFFKPDESSKPRHLQLVHSAHDPAAH